MKYQGIIFDLDGVICFTDHYHYLAWKAIADEEHIYFDETINNRLRGVSRMDSLDIILERATRTYSLEEKEALATKKNEIYKQYLLTMSPKDMNPNTLNTLLELKKMGVKIAIGSSSKNTRLILKQLGITKLFDAISDGNNISKSKPDPEVFLKAAEMLKMEPKNLLVMEDALAGIEAAYRGGFHSIGIGEATTHPHVNYPVEKFPDILEIIK